MSAAAHLLERVEQWPVGVVDEVAEDVHVAGAVGLGADLHAWGHSEAGPLRCIDSLGQAGHGVVIRDAQRTQPRLNGKRHELRRREVAVGGGGVGVQVAERRHQNSIVAYASIRILLISGRVNSSGRSLPSWSISRTLVPLRKTRSEASCGQVLSLAMWPQPRQKKV